MRTLRAKFYSHLGLSYRTGKTLNKKEQSHICKHIINCQTDIDLGNFEILDSCPDDYSLRILESLYLKKLNPTFNYDLSATPLHVI